MIKKNVFLTAAVLTIMVWFAITGMDASADFKYDYYDYDEMVTVLEDLEAQSSLLTPDVYVLQVIGYSLEGNPIHAVKFSDDPGTEEDGEPDILIDGGIHSNEWMGPESTIKYIEYLFDAYYDGGHPDHTEVVDFVHNFEIWFIPMINPDGRNRDDQNGGDPQLYWTDTTFHDDTAGWRMNVQEVDCPSKPGGTNVGIDLNRNFSYKFWEFSNCELSIYNGGAAFSAPESKVLKQFINNHMISLILHQHSNAQSMTAASSNFGLGNYLVWESASIFNDDPSLPDPLMVIWTRPQTASTDQDTVFKGSLTERGNDFVAAASGVCSGSAFTGQYYNWAWEEIDCVLAPDNFSRRGIQMIMYEYPYDDGLILDAYGHPDEGKIGQYLLGDGSNGFHPSSGETNQWIIDKSIEINKYFIQQSQYPFSPRNYTDMSRKPEAPDTDLAMVGSKISEVGTGLPGCFTYDDYGRDVLASGMKRITWNVQNNGTGIRAINSEITICNVTDDPDCLSPTTAVLSTTDVAPEVIETFTYDYDFQDTGSCKDYTVTLTTGETNDYNNDHKRYVFTVTSASDDDCDGVTNSSDNCAEPNGPVGGVCMSGKVGALCRSDDWCAPENQGVCSLANEDNYPPLGNDCGDACECEGNFDGDQDCDGSDAAQFKGDFGRSPFFTPCTNLSPCKGDFDCDVDVDGTDAAKFKEDFGRSQFSNPCPDCPTDPWCVYTP